MTRLTRREWLVFTAGASLGILIPPVRRASAQKASDIGAEIDENYYLPQKHGLKTLLGEFDVEELQKRLKNSLDSEIAGNPQFPIRSNGLKLEGLYSWDADRRTRFAIDGWPKGYDPLELKRHQGVHQQMAEIIVPDEHAYFFKDFDLQVDRKSDGLVVTGRKKVAYSKVDSFTKTFSKDFMKSNLKGAGPQAIFETDAQFQMLQGKRVFRELNFKVRVGTVDLRYRIEPFYGLAEGFMLPSRVTLTYFDENDQVTDAPFEIANRQYAVNAKSKKTAKPDKK